MNNPYFLQTFNSFLCTKMLELRQQLLIFTGDMCVCFWGRSSSYHTTHYQSDTGPSEGGDQNDKSVHCERAAAAQAASPGLVADSIVPIV
jgi:hypothetical protein